MTKEVLLHYVNFLPIQSLFQGKYTPKLSGVREH
jgi:hypothetical protein